MYDIINYQMKRRVISMTIKPYCIVYRTALGVEHEEYFENERSMENHANIWLDGDEDYVEYYYYNKEYTPTWMK